MNKRDKIFTLLRGIPRGKFEAVIHNIEVELWGKVGGINSGLIYHGMSNTHVTNTRNRLAETFIVITPYKNSSSS